MHKQGSIFSENPISIEIRFLCRAKAIAALNRRNIFLFG